MCSPPMAGLQCPETSQDVEEAQGTVADALMQRLILKPTKISQLAAGIRAIAQQEEPIRRLLSRTEVADGEPG
jgi:delta-1-pyrroline-5-carboxylate synthetase